MQLLCISSLEFGFTKGLGLINAKVIKWKKNPDIHIGFNSVEFKKETLLLKNLENYSDFYFVHSFYLKIDKKISGLTGITKFNNKFISAYENKNIFATQFHPEKSQKNGLIVLKNFCEM